MKMSYLINRKMEGKLREYLQIFPAVAILGSRQCGKSTMIKMFAEKQGHLLYVDLQHRADRQKLDNPSLFFRYNEDATVCLDEVQLLPELFSDLRVEIDRVRRPGRFVLLGSASRELLQRTSESLAGRIGLIDLTPFLISEVVNQEEYSIFKYWFRERISSVPIWKGTSRSLASTSPLR